MLTSPPNPRPALWPALLAGAAGGALAGAADVVATLVRGVGGLGGARAVWFAALGIGVAGLAGLALAAVTAGLGAALVRARPAVGRVAAVVLLAAPVVAYDAFALFSGARASRIPARHALSAVLIVLGLAAVALLAGGYMRLLRHAERSRRVAVPAAAAVALLAAAVYWANREILPRLYPWFHATLAGVFLALCVLSVRLLLARREPPGPRSALGLAGLVAVLLAAALPQVAESHTVRFAAYERAPVTGVLLRGLPLRLQTRRPSPPPRSVVAPEETALPEGPRLPGADVVLITIDALRADHIGAYGYPRNTTPNLDALARKSVVFERAYAQAPHTSFSIASMLTGKYYPTIARLRPGDGHESLASILRRYGWRTGAFYPPAVFTVEGHKLRALEETHFGFEYVKVEFLPAPARLGQIDEFFRLERPRRAFLWLHLFEPHEPYETREGHDFGPRDIDRYDSEIAYTDAVVGELLAYLEANRPGAIVIVSADHGEEFEEHGGRYHGSTLFEEQIRVPLIMHVPGVSPRVVAGPVELVDLAPTVLGLLDIPIPARMRGNDLGPWLATPPAPASRLPPAFAEVRDKRMVVWGSEKLICDLNWGYCELYDLAADPGEKKNRAEERPDRVAALRERLDLWLDEHTRFEPELARGPANPYGGEVPRAIERGRLGDLMAVPELVAMLTAAGQPLRVRREAARLLVALPARTETRPALAAALGVSDPELRDWVAVAATRLGEPGAIAQARAIVARAPARGPLADDVRIHAALALAQAGDAAGVPVMSAALPGCGEEVTLCQRVVLALGKLRDRRAVPALLAHLPGWENRREVVQALGEIGDPAALEPLVERLKGDEYVPVRAEAARALARLGGDHAEAALEWSVRNEREPMVLAAARQGLDALRGRGSSPEPTPDTARSPRRAEAR